MAEMPSPRELIFGRNGLDPAQVERRAVAERPHPATLGDQFDARLFLAARSRRIRNVERTARRLTNVQRELKTAKNLQRDDGAFCEAQPANACDVARFDKPAESFFEQVQFFKSSDGRLLRIAAIGAAQAEPEFRSHGLVGEFRWRMRVGRHGRIAAQARHGRGRLHRASTSRAICAS